jgi:hypothetical protein
MSNAKKNKTDRLGRTPPTCMEDPFAVTSSGVVLLNVQNFDNVETAEEGLRRALREPSQVFIGIVLEPREVALVLHHLGDLVHEPAGFVIGSRQRRGKHRR